MKTPASFMDTGTVLLLALLCKGTLSQSSLFTLSVNSSVSVQRGLCVDVPCNFTYDRQLRVQNQNLNGYWLKIVGEETTDFPNNVKPIQGRLVATSDGWMRYKIHQSALNRFQFTGDLKRVSCSFRINDVHLEDSGTYYFRLENGGLRYSYTNFQLEVLVTELTEKPQIQSSTEIVWGKPVTFTCQAPGTCSGTPPGITWTSPLGSRQGRSQSHQHNNGSWTYTSELTLTLTLADQGKPLTCLVTYPAVWATAEGTIYPPYQPKNMKIKPTINRAGKVVPSSPGKDLVAQEGDTVTLDCQAEAIPDPTLTWMKDNKNLGIPVMGKKNQHLLRIRPEDAGEYHCRAENAVGSTSVHVRLNVHYPPRNMTLHVFPAYKRDSILTQGLPIEVPNDTQLTPEEGDSLHLYCKTDSNPPAKTTWVRKGSNSLSNSANWLNLTGLTLKDEGDYECKAENMMVSLQANLHLNIAYAPKFSNNSHINTTCWHTHNSILCNCSLHAKPPPQIQWQLDGKIINEKSSQQNLMVTASTQGNEVTSSLRWTGSLEGDQSIICFGSNDFGVYTVHFQLIGLRIGNHTAWLISGLCGILVAVTVFLIGLWINKLYKQKKMSSKADTVENVDSVNGTQARAGNSSRIYGNIFPMGKKTPHTNQSAAAGTQVSPGRRGNVKASGSDELHYASLEFKPKNKGIPVIMEDSVEYSEVVRK